MNNEKKQETSKDIVAEMRDATMNSEYDDATVDAWADRIEAAWKREREAGAAAAQICGEIGEMVGREKRGNAAAIREALVRCADIINKFGLAEIVTTPMEVICDIEGIITAALSAPPRNCDIYDAESCRMAYHLHGDGLMTMQAFADWLFAPVEEGATNEQK